jgi:hypothetical protein
MLKQISKDYLLSVLAKIKKNNALIADNRTPDFNYFYDRLTKHKLKIYEIKALRAWSITYACSEINPALKDYNFNYFYNSLKKDYFALERKLKLLRVQKFPKFPRVPRFPRVQKFKNLPELPDLPEQNFTLLDKEAKVKLNEGALNLIERIDR